ncbi:MAG TPA: hypothetical protein VN668_12500 [Stellaceae bacterium]|nr:hypothetical protein [Stellaceae bacterium]
MTARLLLVLAVLLAAAGMARAATAPGDDALVKQCAGELADRLFGSGPRGEASITAQQIRRDGDRTIVALQLASGEGRTIAGSCIFRGGKLFDVK